jgi:hypothetical protein
MLDAPSKMQRHFKHALQEVFKLSYSLARHAITDAIKHFKDDDST